MLLTIPVVFYSGMPFIRNTLRGLRHLNFNMDSLITLGASSAFIYSIYQIFTGGKVYFDTSAMIITLILLGRYIEATAKGKASQTIEMLTELTPKEAEVVVSSQSTTHGQSVASGDSTRRAVSSQEVKSVPISSVQKGNLIRVRPGERIPLDGIVIEGESEVDESIITGESRPVLKTSVSEVIGGSMNLYGTFIFKVTKTAKETVLSSIIKAVEDAQARKPKIQILADRVVGIFVPVILIIALSTVIFYLLKGSSSHFALMTGISVLVIACPCSLGLATPLAVLIFTTMASTKGILIRGGEVIENISKLTYVIFDKTGTITVGKPVLKEVILMDPDLNKEHMLTIAASIESLSEHSIGHAITEAAKGLNLSHVSGFKVIPGRGIEGVIDNKRVVIGNRSFMYENGMTVAPLQSLDHIVQQFENNGDTVVYMVWDKAVKAIFVISDIVRAEASEVIDSLKKENLEVSLISGDNKATTNSIASPVGIEDVISEASPIMKKDIIHALQQKGKKVMMVGDGINDAPSLTEASLGVAMGRGTDIAMESADAVLVRNDLRLIPYLVRISRKTYAIIKQNVFWAFFYNIVAIPLAVAGVLHPIIAAGAMAASSLIVVINSLRITRIGQR